MGERLWRGGARHDSRSGGVDQRRSWVPWFHRTASRRRHTGGAVRRLRGAAAWNRRGTKYRTAAILGGPLLLLVSMALALCRLRRRSVREDNGVRQTRGCHCFAGSGGIYLPLGGT